MKIALRALSCNSTFDSSETPENFSSTAFHNPCSIREDRILIFQRLKLVPPSNFGTSNFADDVGTTFDVISSQITHKPSFGSSTCLATADLVTNTLDVRQNSFRLTDQNSKWYESIELSNPQGRVLNTKVFALIYPSQVQ